MSRRPPRSPRTTARFPYSTPVRSAIAWRGPMVAGALNQLLADAEWGDTDPIVLDMPPGTGDIQLTVVQKHRPVGAVIVSTPQDLALIDARRGDRKSTRLNSSH